jgi:hypothetical protein
LETLWGGGGGEMTPEQQRVAIAEACGWKWEKFWTGELYGKPVGEQGPLMELPDYLNDLNAMHDAEKVLTPEQLVDYCAFRLRATTGEGCVTDYKMIRATASQRAEAFLRTIGKWEEAK